MTTPQGKYRARHPERVAATLKNIQQRTIKRSSVRFMVGRDDALIKWLEAAYGGSGGPEILAALNEAKEQQQ